MAKFNYEKKAEEPTAMEPQDTSAATSLPTDQTTIKSNSKRSPKEIVKLHQPQEPSEKSGPFYKIKQNQSSTARSQSKEEEERALESKLLAAKRLNAETAQQQAEAQQRRQQKLAEQRRSEQKMAEQALKNAGEKQLRREETKSKLSNSLPVPSRGRSKRKTLTDWKENVKNSNPQGAKMAGSYKDEPSRKTNFYHQSLADQMAQSDDDKTSMRSWKDGTSRQSRIQS